MISKVFALVLLLASPAFGQDVARIVYLGLDGDPYYEPQAVYTGLSLRDRKRPLDGVRLGFRDTRVLGRALGVKFELTERLIAEEETVAGVLRDVLDGEPLAVLIDLPRDAMAEAIATAQPQDTLINIRDGANHWRQEGCSPALLHSAPSDSMLTDALAQHLRGQSWPRVLLLHSDSERDLEIVEAVRRSAAKFGLRIVDEKNFELTNDPRRRDRNNIALLTGGPTHDVIWIVDDEGEFGRYVPFHTYAARPVVGSEGLSPRAWHWTFERYGAPQLNQRFRRIAERDMTSEDWAAWVAVRSVVDAVTSVRSADRAAVSAALRSQDLSIDLYKGVRGNFRDWNGQLRQPILLATHNAVISVAPLQGFEHRTDTLDTLGWDRPESTCQF
ncbi:MAG: amino acid ABC transporter substrate-binding protein [Rhodobacteraceae bacterium]|nr:amino acid ABC transporter substrate-binding protein [Paracoccaceae bacterium]